MGICVQLRVLGAKQRISSCRYIARWSLCSQFADTGRMLSKLACVPCLLTLACVHLLFLTTAHLPLVLLICLLVLVNTLLFSKAPFQKTAGPADIFKQHIWAPYNAPTICGALQGAQNTVCNGSFYKGALQGILREVLHETSLQSLRNSNHSAGLLLVFSYRSS